MTIESRVMGWVADLPDFRDKLYLGPHDRLWSSDDRMGQTRFPLRGWLWWKKVLYPLNQDLRPQMPAVFDQGDIGSCVSNATVAMLEFLERKEPGTPPTDLSRLFLYDNARLSINHDSGSTFRANLNSIAHVGICTEASWPYDTSKVSVKPDAAAALMPPPARDPVFTAPDPE